MGQFRGAGNDLIEGRADDGRDQWRKAAQDFSRLLIDAVVPKALCQLRCDRQRDPFRKVLLRI